MDSDKLAKLLGLLEAKAAEHKQTAIEKTALAAAANDTTGLILASMETKLFLVYESLAGMIRRVENEV